MSSKTRIYTVTDGGTDYLIRAVSKQQAISFVARKLFECRPATQDDLVDLVSAGVDVQDATLDPGPQTDLLDGKEAQ